MLNLDVQRWPSVLQRDKLPELVLLHGWGTDSHIWKEWLPLLRQHAHVTLINMPGYGDSTALPATLSTEQSLAIYIKCLASELPPRCVLLGFSLGGMIAIKLAKRYPDLVRGVITIASNLRFTANKAWPHAMSQAQYNNFTAKVADEGTQALRQFNGLMAQKCQHQRSLLRLLNQSSDQSRVSSLALQQSLAWLAVLDNQQTIQQLTQPNLHIYGANDQLVPIKAAEQLARSGVAIKIIDGASHVPFLSSGMQLSQTVAQFLRQLPVEKGLDKSRVARSFSRSAVSYDTAANLQRQVGLRLLQSVDVEPTNTILDLGTGTGFFLPSLQTMLSPQQTIALDFAEGMLTYAKYAGRGSDVQWLCADAEKLPLQSESVDLIFSSLAIQWCDNLQLLFEETYRVLKPEGCFVFATLGPETLFELREAWRAVDSGVHVQQFAPRSTLIEALDYFDSYRFEEDFISLNYSSVLAMLKELKALGANQYNSERKAGLMGKRLLMQLDEAYQQFKTASDKIPASYQLWYGKAYKE